MPQITFTIDEHGNLNAHIQGIKGPSCASLAAEIETLLGKPQHSKETDEYRARTNTTQRLTGRNG